MIIDSRNKLQIWLDQNDWFEDGYISRIDFDSGNIEITLGLQTSGSYVAGEQMTTKEFMLKPNSIKTWTFDKSKFTPGNDSCIVAVKLTDERFGLIFETPYIFEFTCDSIEISEPIITETITKPWISDKEFFVTANANTLPKPQYWVESLKEKGFDVGFRYYCGELKHIVDVPYPDYSGFFIQQVDRISKTEKGILFKSLVQDKDKIRLSIELDDNDIDSIWKSMQKIISTWKGLKIDCGNVTFKENEWNLYLEKNLLPDKIEKIEPKNI